MVFHHLRGLTFCTYWPETPIRADWLSRSGLRDGMAKKMWALVEADLRLAHNLRSGSHEPLFMSDALIRELLGTCCLMPHRLQKHFKVIAGVTLPHSVKDADRSSSAQCS